MAAAVVAALTAALKLLGGRVNSTTAALALLLAVLFIAARMESGPALVASVLAMLCFNFFFLPPFGTLHIADPENWVALTAFLHPKEGLASLRTPLTIEPIAIAAPAGDALLARYLDTALNALEASGVLSTIWSRWLERSDWVQQLP